MTGDPDAYLVRVQETFRQKADPAKAAPMAKYMRNLFPFHGVQSPQRRALARSLYRELGLPEGAALKTLCRLCFREEAREIHYFACELLARQVKRLDLSFLELVEELIQTKSWWDTVDILAPRVAGPLLLRLPEGLDRYPERWIRTDNLWLQRAALIYQLKYKKKTDAERLFRYIRRTLGSGEFFVEKAAGWALRQYARVEPGAVLRFAETTDLPPLTRREGLKHLLNPDY